MKKLVLFTGVVCLMSNLSAGPRTSVTCARSRGVCDTPHEHRICAGDICKRIEKYLSLCSCIEKKHACSVDLVVIKVPSQLSDPRIIACYVELAQVRKIKPLLTLWQSIKNSVFTVEKQKLLYEFCYLLLVVLERYMNKLLGPDGQAISEALSVFIPLDELVDVLERCYQRLVEYLHMVDTTPAVVHHWQISKKVVVVALCLLIVGRKLYQALKKSGGGPVALITRRV